MVLTRTRQRAGAPPTEPAERIKWTPEECAKVADRWAALRAGDLWGSANALLHQAIDDSLPEHRRRTLAGPTVFPHELKRRIGDHIRAMQAKIQAKPEDAHQEPPPPPEIVEVEVERAPDPEKILARFSPGELIGKGIDRLFTNRGTATKILERTPAELMALANAEPAKQTNGNGNGNGHTPPPVPVVEERPKVWRVLICGLLGDQSRHVQDKAHTLGNLALSFQGSERSYHVSAGRFDHVVIMRKFVSHAVSRVAENNNGKNRVHYIEGGLTELMQKLAAINSIPRHS